MKPPRKVGPTIELPNGEIIGLDAELMTQIDQLDTIADTIVIDADNVLEARSAAKAALDLFNRVDNDRIALKAPYWDACQDIDAWAKQFTKRLETTKVRLNAKLGEYAMAVERQRQQAEFDRIAAEEAARSTPPVPGRVNAPLPVLPAIPDSAPVPTQLDHDVKITDVNLIPREYLMPDLQRIEWALAQGKIIPGVERVAFRRVVTRGL